MEDTSNIPMFFIIGRPRSGTTLLRLLFEAHPNVIIPPESPIILNLYKKYDKISHWDEKIILSLYHDVINQQYFDTWLIDKEKFKEEILSWQGETTFYELIKKIYLSYPSLYEKGKIEWIGDKNPGYSLYVKRLIKIFPEAKFIHITRDYRDNYLSLIKVNFEVPVVPLVIYRWRFAIQLVRNLKKKFPDSVYSIRYEDLVTDTEKQFKDLCNFLRIEFNQSVLNYYDKKELLKTKYAHSDELLKIHKSLLRPINTGRMDVWKSEMNERDIKVADLVAGKVADSAGYVRKYKKFNLWLFLWILPTLIYGKLMYSMILFGEKLPYKWRNRLQDFLGMFLKAYWKINQKKIKKDTA